MNSIVQERKAFETKAMAIIMVKFIILESRYDGCITYGIALVSQTDGQSIILQSIPDLSPDRERVEQFVRRCTELQLSPLHLNDAVEDFLAE